MEIEGTDISPNVTWILPIQIQEFGAYTNPHHLGLFVGGGTFERWGLRT
jgi:hypothetical protein